MTHRSGEIDLEETRLGLGAFDLWDFGVCEGKSIRMEFWPEFLATTSGSEFVAGGLGGMAGVMAGHPLDTIRIRLQQPRLPSSSAPASAIALVRHIVATEGPTALFKGMASPLATIAFQNAVSFQTYALLSRALADPSEQAQAHPEPLSYERVALAGIGAGTLQTLILSPVDLIKIRLQLQTARRSVRGTSSLGPLTLARNIVRREGFRGLYRGWGITVIRDAPSHGVYFGSYEFIREKLHPGCRSNGEETLLTMLTAGGLAGSLSWLCCYPLDVVKSRLQAQGGVGGSGTRYKGIIDCFQSSMREEGFQVFFRGLGTSLARAYLVNGAIFSAYESTLRFLSPRSPPQSEANLGLRPISP